MTDTENLLGGFTLLAIIGVIVYLGEKQHPSSGAIQNSTQQTTGVNSTYNLPNYLMYNTVPVGGVPSDYYQDALPSLITSGSTTTATSTISGCNCGGSAAPDAQNPVL